MSRVPFSWAEYIEILLEDNMFTACLEKHLKLSRNLY
jgi:hypothetical protein